MYDFHDSTDTLKFWTEKRAINKVFLFSSDFDETWWSFRYPCVLQFHQVSSKSDEKQKRFINSPFFCSDFQSVSRIVKIVHSVHGRRRMRLSSKCSKTILKEFWSVEISKEIQIYYLYWICSDLPKYCGKWWQRL